MLVLSLGSIELKHCQYQVKLKHFQLNVLFFFFNRAKKCIYQNFALQ